MEDLSTPLSSSDNLQTDLELRLEQFVKRFVKEFEAKLTSYSVILDDVIPKSGKYPKSAAEKVGQSVGLALGGVVGLAVGLPELGANTGKLVVGSISKKIEEKVRKNHLQNKVSKLSHFINYFEENGSAFRKMLVTIGLDIFQSFEMQFGRVSSDLGERGAMNRLAIDAVNRSLEYIGRTSAETELDYYTLIVEGVKLGQSKGEPILDVTIPGRRKGFEIMYSQGSKMEMWKTASLYSKVGIVVMNERGRIYYSLKSDKNKSVKYGFRRLLTYEKWEELKSLYAKSDANENLLQFLSYNYFFTPGMMNEKINQICAKLQTERDKKLGIDRVYALIKESKDELLEKLHILKPMYDKAEEESKVLAKIESDLINLNLEEYFSMFDLKMNHVLDEISKENLLTHAKLERITISIDEIKDKVDSISQGSSRAITPRNSVWFDVRNELLTFTGRETVLSQIDMDLKVGIVVICGLGGIGKSELAVKYVRSRYQTSDNVIWINADTEESMLGSVWQLAQVLNLKHETMTDINVVIAEIYNIILDQNCLLIFDNAKNLSDVEMFLKFSNDVTAPKVIVTSRNSSGWNSGRFAIQLIQLEVFDSSEATEFVKKSLSIENDSLLSADIEKLIETLGNFPLALQLAVTNIKITNSNYVKRNKQFTIAMFLEKFNNQPQKLMCGILPLDTYRQPCSIFIVVGYTLKDLENENDVLGSKAQLILKMAAYMAADNIREEFFLDEFDDEDELMAVMNLLENYSLVKINQGKLTIHRLVQQSIRFVSEKEEEVILRKNLNLLMKRLKSWDNITLYTPHVIAIWDHACNYNNLIEEFIINSSTKFYIYTSFLETLVQRNRIKVVKKIIDQIKYSSRSNKLIAILNNLFGEKSMHFAVTNPEMMELLKKHGIQPPNSKRNSGVIQSAFSLGVGNKEPIEEAISMRSELGGIPKRWSGISDKEIS